MDKEVIHLKETLNARVNSRRPWEEVGEKKRKRPQRANDEQEPANKFNDYDLTPLNAKIA